MGKPGSNPLELRAFMRVEKTIYFLYHFDFKDCMYVTSVCWNLQGWEVVQAISFAHLALGC